MKTFVQAILYATSIGGLLVLLMLTGSRYDWMTDLGSANHVIVDTADDRGLVKFLILLVIAACQSAVVGMARSKTTIVIATIVFAIAVLLWLL